MKGGGKGKGEKSTRLPNPLEKLAQNSEEEPSALERKNRHAKTSLTKKMEKNKRGALGEQTFFLDVGTKQGKENVETNVEKGKGAGKTRTPRRETFDGQGENLDGRGERKADPDKR